MALTSNTVRLKAEFKTFADVLADPTGITLKIYDKFKKQIGTTITITSANKVSTGVYQYDYTIPTGYTYIVYEYAGTLEGSVVLGRNHIDIEWLEND